jgi:hypothetical protein
MKFIWPESARAELRGIDRETTMRILLGLTSYGDSGEGDVKLFRVIGDRYRTRRMAISSGLTEKIRR